MVSSGTYVFCERGIGSCWVKWRCDLQSKCPGISGAEYGSDYERGSGGVRVGIFARILSVENVKP